MTNLPVAVVKQIIKARDAARSELERLETVVSALNGGGHATTHKRILSKDARGRIAEAQRIRWAKLRAAKTKTSGSSQKNSPKNSQKSYWARFTPEERKKEMARRMKVREKNAAAGK